MERRWYSISQPYYVDNFLGFPVGEDVPAGYYDSAKGAWIAADNGRVIKILDTSGGSARLDLDGSGQPANAAVLTALGITVPRAGDAGFSLYGWPDSVARPFESSFVVGFQLAVRPSWRRGAASQ